jgi:hypothetical protein
VRGGSRPNRLDAGGRRRTFPFSPWIERFALWFFLVLVSHGPAIAVEISSPEAQANARLEAGNERLDSGDIAGAITEYRAGFALFPRATFLFNIGIAELRRGHLVEAAEALQAVQNRPEATPEVIGLAREQLTRLDQKLTRLELVRDPLGPLIDGALVDVDGRARGTLPLAHPLRLPPGPHTVRVTKPGRSMFERQISTVAGGHLILPISLPTPPPPAASRTPRYWLWGTVGAAVAAAAVAGFVALRRHDPGFEPCPTGMTCADFVR